MMALNKFLPHLVVLPEDDANRQIANGFLLQPALQAHRIQVLPPAGGWTKVVEKFSNAYVPTMQAYSERRVLLIMDFDKNVDSRLSQIKNAIPSQLSDRTFILGALSKPEAVRASLGKNFEEIGKSMAQDCVEATRTVWNHDLLQHNQAE